MSITLKLKQLSQIDIETLREIDFHELKNKILERPIILINGGIIVGTLIIAIMINGFFAVKHAQLKTDSQMLSEKLSVAERNLNLKNQIESYKTNFPKLIAPENLMTEVSRLAQKHGIKVLSLTPQKGVSINYLKTDEIKVYITSKSFKRLLLYIKEIELLPYAVVINSLSSNIQDVRSRSRNNSVEESTPEISVNFSLQTMELKHE